jgi:hypothetical protein
MHCLSFKAEAQSRALTEIAPSHMKKTLFYDKAGSILWIRFMAENKNGPIDLMEKFTFLRFMR